MWRNGSFQRQPIQRTASAQRYIHLSEGERGMYINDCLVECKSLAFMHRYCPRQPQWILLKLTNHILLYLVCFAYGSIEFLSDRKSSVL